MFNKFFIIAAFCSASFFVSFACQKGVPIQRQSSLSRDTSIDSTSIALYGMGPGPSNAPSGTYGVDNGCDALLAQWKICQLNSATTGMTGPSVLQGETGGPVQTTNSPSQTGINLAPQNQFGLGLVDDTTTDTSSTASEPTTTGSTTPTTTQTSSSATSTVTSLPNTATSLVTTDANCLAVKSQVQMCIPDTKSDIVLNDLLPDLSAFFTIPGSAVRNMATACAGALPDTSYTCKTYTTFSTFDGKTFTTKTLIAGCKGIGCIANGPEDMCSGCKLYPDYAPVTVQTVFTLLKASGQ